jgi:hypothetical protein
VVPRAPEEPAPSSEAAIPKPAGAVPTTALPPSPIVPAVGGPEPRDLEAPETLAIPEALPDASERDALLEQLAQNVQAFRAPAGSKRKAIAVSKNVFSRVSYLAYEKGVDKVAILTYLLDRYLPEDKSERQPRWISQTNENDHLDYLSYFEDAAMAKRLRWVQAKYGLSRVHAVERIVLAHLPASPIQIPAKQRHKGGYAFAGPRR